MNPMLEPGASGKRQPLRVLHHRMGVLHHPPLAQQMRGCEGLVMRTCNKACATLPRFFSATDLPSFLWSRGQK